MSLSPKIQSAYFAWQAAISETITPPLLEGNNLAHCMCAMKIAKQEIPHAAGGLIVRLADASVFSWGASK